jgi:hypothetical protein
MLGERVVRGEGLDELGEYEITWYSVAKKYYLERGEEKIQITLAEAVHLTDRAYVGRPGGEVWDRHIMRRFQGIINAPKGWKT